MRDLAYDLAEHVSAVRYADLPPEVVEVTKKFILDTLGTSLAGSNAPGCAAVKQLVVKDGGREESTLLVFGNRVPAPNAAFVNSMLAHAVEFDDTHDPTSVHANCTVLPAALAMSERLGGGTGKALIEAVAVGVDLTCRLGLGREPLKEAAGWTPAAVFGYFGAAAACARLLGFSAEQTHNAMGICYSQCAGNRQPNTDRATVKRMQVAFAARGALQSCELAEIGITGSKNIFEGAVGITTLYFGGKYSRTRILDGLGKRFLGTELSVKPYPSARPTHRSIDATLEIVREHDLKPDDIDHIVVHVVYGHMRSAGAPFEPNTISQVQAQFSIAYCVAVAIARRGLYLEDFVEDNIRKDIPVQELTKKVQVVQDQEPVGPGLLPTIVDIVTKSGKLYSKRTEVIITGDRDHPIDIDWVEQKFRRCARFAAKPIAEGRLDEIASTVRGLEKVDDVAALVKLMC